MENPVDRQLEAFSERNLERCLEPYAADTAVEDGAGAEIMRPWRTG